MVPKGFLSLVLFLCLLCSIACADVRTELEARTDSSRLISLPGNTQVRFYPQTNRRYAGMKYEYRESRTRRTFGEGGCAPCAAASSLSLLVSPEELLVLNHHTADGQPFSICPHAVNAWSCDSCTRLQLVTPEDVSSYLPLMLGSYACGNNDLNRRWRRASGQIGGSGGTNAQFLQEICLLLGLQYQLLEDYPDDVWLSQLDGSTAAVCLSVSSPFTGGNHYVAAVAADERYVYLLDPMDKYAYSKEHDDMRMLHVIEHGLVRVRRDLYRYLGFYTVHLLSLPQ